MWNEDSFILYLRFLAEEIRSRRAQLGLSAKHRAMVLMDQAGAHMSQTYLALQAKCEIEDSLRADAWHNKLIWLSWFTRGYSTRKMVAEWHFGGSSSVNAGEDAHVWALQVDDDSCTRFPLPDWVGVVLEMRISKFVSDFQRWEKIIGQRAFQNRSLTVTQQQRHRAFQANMTQTLVFNKRTKTYAGDLSEVKRGAKDLFVMTLHLSDQPQELLVDAANGESFRLVLLKNSVRAAEEIPSVIDHLPAAPVHGVAPVVEDDPDENEDDGPRDLSEAEILALENEQFEAEQGEGEPEEEEETFLLADTDDEMDVAMGLPTSTVRVKSFHMREAWQTLTARGLSDLPRHISGCSMSYHSTSRQWQGYYPNSTETMSATWGPPGKRTEIEALLRSIRGVLQAHVSANPRDVVWKRQLERRLLIFSVDAGSKTSEKGRAAAERLVNEMIQEKLRGDGRGRSDSRARSDSRRRQRSRTPPRRRSPSPRRRSNSRRRSPTPRRRSDSRR
eukprot:s787_g13.t1